jgi:hypothetical protein
MQRKCCLTLVMLLTMAGCTLPGTKQVKLATPIRMFSDVPVMPGMEY